MKNVPRRFPKTTIPWALALALAPLVHGSGPLDQWHSRNAGAINSITALTYDATAGEFVAVDEVHPVDTSDTPAALLRSTDGVNWSRQVAGTNRLWTSCLASGNGGHLAVRYSPFALPAGDLMGSADGVNWSNATPDESFIRSVKLVNGSTLAAGGRTGEIIICDLPPCPEPTLSLWMDGRETVLATPQFGSGSPFDSLTLAVADFAYGNGAWVVLGWVFWAQPLNPFPGTPEARLFAWSSTDGTNFSRSPALRSGFFPSGGGLNTHKVGLAFGDGRFVAVSGNNQVLTSTDGASWEAAVVSATAGFNDVVHGGDEFVTVGTGGAILSSADGVQWQPRPSGSEVTFHSVEYGDYSFLAIGDVSTVLQSSPVIHLRLSLDGGFRLHLSAPPASSCRIEATSTPADPESWSPRETVAITTDPFLWIDSNPPGDGPRFYRAVLVE